MVSFWELDCREMESRRRPTLHLRTRLLAEIFDRICVLGAKRTIKVPLLLTSPDDVFVTTRYNVRHQLFGSFEVLVTQVWLIWHRHLIKKHPSWSDWSYQDKDVLHFLARTTAGSSKSVGRANEPVSLFDILIPNQIGKGQRKGQRIAGSVESLERRYPFFEAMFWLRSCLHNWLIVPARVEGRVCGISRRTSSSDRGIGIRQHAGETRLGRNLEHSSTTIFGALGKPLASRLLKIRTQQDSSAQRRCRGLFLWVARKEGFFFFFFSFWFPRHALVHSLSVVGHQVSQGSGTLLK